MLFSIVVPIYNVETYIERCIACLREQTYKDIEILLVDDESPDNCPEICDRYAGIDSRIKVIHKKNGGLSDARNYGLAASNGDYVLFVDSDDYIDIDTCEKFLEFAETGSDILVGGAEVEGGMCDLQQMEPSDRIYTGKEYLKEAYSAGKAHMASWMNAYKRQFLIDNDLKFKYGILHEDEQFTPRAFLKAETVVNTGVVFYHYIVRDGSITTQKDKRKNAKDLYATCCELEKLYLMMEDETLKVLLRDSLATKYLNMTQIGRLYRYKDEFAHKDFVKRNAFCKRTKIKSILYCFSPVLYYYVNAFVKKLFGR